MVHGKIAVYVLLPADFLALLPHVTTYSLYSADSSNLEVSTGLLLFVLHFLQHGIGSEAYSFETD